MSELLSLQLLSHDELYKTLKSSPQGLSEEEAGKRLSNQAGIKQRSQLSKDAFLFLLQFKSPLVLLLVFGLTISAALGELMNSIIIFLILLLSGTLGFIQERKAGKAAEKLRKLVQSKATVQRGGQIREIEINKVVTGDIIHLNAGDIIPADSIIIECKDLYVNESILTGESFPAEKRAEVISTDELSKKSASLVFKGTHVVSGTAIVIAAETGLLTEIGQIELKSGAIIEHTAFETGLRKFGFLLMQLALVLAGGILIFNISVGKPAIDSILFALALSLGLTPELLPAIVTITLSSGAKRLAQEKVIVKKLASIQNLGSIDILCCDKTGTLTEGVISINSFLSAEGTPSEEVCKYAFINSSFESGYNNPIDDAIRKQLKIDISDFTKFDEVPFDFIRKRLSIVTATKEGKHIMITKGAVNPVLDVCSSVQQTNGTTAPIALYIDKISKHVNDQNASGYRVIAIAHKDVTDDPVINKDDEKDMTFLGTIALSDPLKAGITNTIQELRNNHVSLKIITGDNITTATAIASQLNVPAERVMSGSQLDNMDDHALMIKAKDTDVFAETVPSQKERIVKALQHSGYVVGYMGDGINDAPALKAADVGISVNNAVDIAKESSDIILLEKELGAVIKGIVEGRKTYLNTLKYILITISANFGNMISMAIASALLPFLPLLPSQILLTNFLTDLPALSISSDKVDKELLEKPRQWNISFIRRFMLIFGLESSIFDLITFVVLIRIIHANFILFRTGWFVESVITEILLLFIIRTRRAFIKSPPGMFLLTSSALIVTFVLVIPFIPFSRWLGFTPVPATVMFSMLLITIVYAICSEITKKIIFRKL